MNRHRNRQGGITPPEDAREILGVAANAGDAEIRAAYLRKVKENPPDRAPEQFERIRDAYELLRDPRRRALQMLLGSGSKRSAGVSAAGPSGGETLHRAWPLAGGLEGEVNVDREEILRRFEAWLDRVLAAEESPQGIAAELLASLSAESAATSARANAICIRCGRR